MVGNLFIPVPNIQPILTKEEQQPVLVALIIFRGGRWTGTGECQPGSSGKPFTDKRWQISLCLKPLALFAPEWVAQIGAVYPQQGAAEKIDSTK